MMIAQTFNATDRLEHQAEFSAVNKLVSLHGRQNHLDGAFAPFQIEVIGDVDRIFVATESGNKGGFFMCHL